MSTYKINFNNIVDDSWRYVEELQTKEIRGNFLYAVSSFNEKTSRLANSKWGIRIVSGNIKEAIVIKEVSGVYVDTANAPCTNSHLNISSDDIPESASEAVVFRGMSKVAFAVWLIEEKRLIVPNSETQSIVSFIIRNYPYFFGSEASRNDRQKELELITEGIRHSKIFSIGGDPEFEVINAVEASKNCAPEIIEARFIQIASTDPHATVGADSTGWQVELRPEVATFNDSMRAEDVADEFVTNSTAAFSKYASSFTQGLSSYGQKYHLGHHIHIGSLFKLKNPQKADGLVQALDTLLGKPLSSLISPLRYNSSYGKLSDTEGKHYGFEYRTPNAVWSHPELAKKVFTIVVRLIQKIASEGFSFDSNEDYLTLLDKLGFDSKFAESYSAVIAKFVEPENRIDTLGNWEVRKTYPAVSWRFTYNVRATLLKVSSNIPFVFLVGNTNKTVLFSNPNRGAFIEAINAVSQKYDIPFELHSDREDVELSQFLATDPPSNGSGVVLIETDENGEEHRTTVEQQSERRNGDGSSNERRREGTRPRTTGPSVTTVSQLPPINGLTQIIVPNTLDESFYMSLANICNETSRRD